MQLWHKPLTQSNKCVKNCIWGKMRIIVTVMFSFIYFKYFGNCCIATFFIQSHSQQSHRERLWDAGLSTQLQTSPPERVGPELQWPTRLGGAGTVQCTDGFKNTQVSTKNNSDKRSCFLKRETEYMVQLSCITKMRDN